MSAVSTIFSLLKDGLPLLFFDTKEGFIPIGVVVDGQYDDFDSI